MTGNLPSSIDGSLTATGSLYLVNPAGVAVGTGGMVRTGGSFVASTHDASNADFLDGGNLTLKGDSKAAVVNRGFVSSLSGDVVLMARRVENAGTIDAQNGSVGLLGGYEVEMRDTSLADGKFSVKVGGPDTEVVNSGTIRAAEIEMRANGGTVQALAGNTKAIVKATGVKKVGGRIFLTAGNGGTVRATQKMVARRAAVPATRAEVAVLPSSGPLPSARPDFDGGEVHIASGTVSLGGSIDVSGAGGDGGTIIAVAREQLELTEATSLDASGDAGGLVLLGGDFQGGKDQSANYWSAPLATAARTSVAKGATIAADGDSGAGGQIVVWADDHTRFAGHISATGIASGGNAEVSGKAVLEFAGTADLTSSSGRFGTLLLDPYNVTISAGADANQSGFTATGDNSVINAATLLTALNTANVTVSTGAGGSQAGDITVAAPLAWTSDATLTLDAAGGIAIDADITARAGGLTLDAGGAIGATGAIDIARFTLAAGAWTQNAATLPSFATGDFRIDGGSFLRATGGDGGATTPWLLADIYGIQGMATHLAGNFALAGDVDASGTQYWHDGAGFAPVGHDSSPFTGSLDGKGNVISGLIIDRPTQDYVGLFGHTQDARIVNIGLDGGSIVGLGYVGGLVGAQATGTIERVWATGAVTGETSVGGLVGMQTGGSVTDSFWDMGTTGQPTSAAGTGLTTAQARSKTSYTGWDFTNDWYQAGDLRPIGRWIANDAVLGVVAVDNLIQLQLMGADLGASYVLTRNIDASATASTANSRGIWGADGFVPVGSPFTQFTGDFDGQDHVISGLTIDRPAQDYVGLFGYARGADIRNVGLEGGAFTGNHDVGALIGMQEGGAAERVWASGRVTGLSNVGGLVGIQIGGGGIKQAWASGRVSGPGTNIGGLVGLQNDGTIDQAWASGAVGGGGSVGGLLGTQIGGTVTRSWASGAVSGDVNLGGLVGLRTGGSVADSFWDIGTSGQASSDAGTGLTTAQARNAASYTNWNFTTDWYQAGDLRPIGRWMAAAPDANGDIPVSNLIQLQLMGADPAANYVLTRDIDASATAANATNPAGIWGAGGFVPVGYDTTIDPNGIFDGVPFSGSLDGQDRVISGLTINRPTEAYVGLFGRADGAAIGNVGLDGGAISGSYRVGGLVGLQDSGSISRAWISATVTGANGSVGGLVGRQAGGSITQSWTSGAITGRGSVGGLVGWQDGGSVAASFWDTDTTGQAGGLGAAYGGTFSATGLTTAEFQDTAGFMALAGAQGWDFKTVWAPPSSGYYPQLYAMSRIVAVDVSNNQRFYGDGNADLVINYYGLGEGDFLITRATLSGAPDATAGVGDYTVTASGGGATTTPEAYRFVYIPGTLAITPRPLTVTGGAIDRVYGDVNPATTTAFTAPLGSTGSGGGLVNGDTIASVTVASTADATSGIGSYAFTPGGAIFSAGNAANYAITYVDGALSVTPRAITVTADDLSRIYGDANPALTWTVGGMGLVNGDALSGLLSTVAGATSNVGSYGIGQGTLAASANYALTFNAGTLSVTPRAITVTADDLSRIYGDANPALTWTVGGMGLVNGDALSGSLATAGSASNVGSYGIDRGTLAASANYALTFNAGTLLVTPRAITVTADDLRRLQGQPDPELTWTLTSGNLASFDTAGDVFSGGLTRDPGEAVGDYAIGQGSLTANANYTLAFLGGVLTIDPVAMVQDQVLERSPAAQSFVVAWSGAEGDVLAECAEGVLGPVCVPFVNPANRNLGPNISWQAPQ